MVRSGLAFAGAVLHALENDRVVKVSFQGLKGASSSYFNVFLRRIQEGCGLTELGNRILPEFGSNIQKMVYDRSLEAISKGPRNPIQPVESRRHQDSAQAAPHKPFWKRLLGW